MIAPRIGIVGGGPAGCAAAISVARTPFPARKEVLLFEAGTISKDKPCGDALVPEALEALSACGIDDADILELGGCRYRDIVVAAEGRFIGSYPMTPRSGWVIRRAVLDRRLREIAGQMCQLCLQSKVISVQRVNRGFRLSVARADRTELVDVDAVVLATGANGNIAKEYDLSGSGIQAIAITQYSSAHRLRDVLRFDFRRSLKPGYIWWFPVGHRGANWGVWAPTGRSAKTLASLRDRMVRLSSFPGYSSPRAAVARLWSGRGRIWHHPNGIVSCGDAAGLIDPYNGEGISAALTSGARAGSAVASFLAGDRNALEEYSNWVRDFFGSRYNPKAESTLFWIEIAGSLPTDYDLIES